MTPKEKDERVEQIKSEFADFDTYDYDPEYTHNRADELLCELLEMHGYNEIVRIFKSLTKWYA